MGFSNSWESSIIIVTRLQAVRLGFSYR